MKGMPEGADRRHHIQAGEYVVYWDGKDTSRSVGRAYYEIVLHEGEEVVVQRWQRHGGSLMRGRPHAVLKPFEAAGSVSV